MKKNPPSPVDEIEESMSSLDYDPGDDIYKKSKRQENIDPDDNSVLTGSHEKEGTMNEKNFEEDMSGSDLDVPGTELDDINEEIGEEDEENNYYSLGGDNHGDLEESND